MTSIYKYLIDWLLFIEIGTKCSPVTCLIGFAWLSVPDSSPRELWCIIGFRRIGIINQELLNDQVTRCNHIIEGFSYKFLTGFPNDAGYHGRRQCRGSGCGLGSQVSILQAIV
jgi:hypothetical protein